MKILRQFKISLVTMGLAATFLASAVASADVPQTFEQSKQLRIAVVNFKTCVEKSKIGQKEQATFEGMKKQMESILVEKEKSLNEVATKFNDMDYLDSLSQDAEAALKHQYRTLNQEFSQQQNQFYQTLQQANVMIVQKLTQEVTKATEEVAKMNKIDLILTEESLFFFTPTIDISDMVVKIMDESFAKDSKDLPAAAKLPTIEPKK